MKCPLLKITKETIKDNYPVRIEEFQDCIGPECRAYIQPAGTVFNGNVIKETVEDCRMMRK